MIEPFVDGAWLQNGGSDAVLADVRFYLDGRSGQEAYAQGHLPGAVYVELADVLSEASLAPSAGRHPLPSPERFARGLGEIGIGDGDTVIAYDDDGGLVAARLVWLLRTIGHEAALLNGGLKAWNGAVETGPGVQRRTARFTPVQWPAESFAGIDEVAVTTARLIDARDPARFGGGPDPVDPRSGHIPGALNVPARAQLGLDGRVGSAPELRERFAAAAGIGPGTPVISYCGSGVTACFNLLAMERAGLGPGRLYVGSWSQWSRDPARPVET